MANTTILESYDFKGLDEKLKDKQKYVIERYNYYNDEQSPPKYSFIGSYAVSSDAIKKTIDDIRNRCLVSHFINAKNVEQYFTKNFLNKTIKSCLVSGCSFARVIKNENGEIELIPYDAYYATGTLNNNNLLEEAISIDDTDEKGNPTIITYYSKDKIKVIDLKNEKETITNNDLGLIPLIPIIVNQNALKPFGSSFITKKMMRDTDSLRRTKQRAEVVAETLSTANTFLLGLSKDFKEDLDEASLRRVKDIIMITKDADSQSPTVARTENGSDQLEQKIKDLENSIMYDTSNVNYSDMIVSIQQDLTDSFNLVSDMILKVLSNDKNARLNGRLDIVFKNNDFNNFSAFMDGVLKINQVLPGYLSNDQLDKILGIKGNKPNLLNLLENGGE